LLLLVVVVVRSLQLSPPTPQPQPPTHTPPTNQPHTKPHQVGPTAFEVARRFTDDVVSVDEKMIALAMLRLLENERCVVEGGGATGLAALLPGGPLDLPEYKNKNVVVLLCGGNIDITMLGRVIDRGLAADGRLIRFIATGA
jgi:threonine dehydratase